ncbi:MerR family transcriptional regulator [Raoultibacter phocaeensis]|uniref:MerR family transcriptional regulator n=1 Tax=Raoultibacter phocaeensis TaxID=2479841 RepID=UPI0011188B32|nr:MerR family transcriptional regulator [Raoultibacter phocaeensis]
MLTIGEFSRTCFVTKKTLRHYDDIGLLRPAHVAENGYRYYTVGQIRTMRLILRLKAYGFSLPEIAAHLANPDSTALSQKLVEKQRLMESERDQTERVLRRMEQDIEKLERNVDIMEQNITVTTVEREPQTIFGIRKNISVQDFQELFGELYAAAGKKGLQPLGGPMAFYHDEDFNAEHTDIEVALPVAAGTPGSRELAGGLHACSTLVGPYDSDAFTAIYAGLMQWIDENGYHVANSPFDSYVKGGPEVDPKDYVTEVYFPIAK